MQPAFPEEPFERLIERAVARAINSSALDDFLAWFLREIAREPQTGPFLDEQGVRALGTMLGRTVWSATPAPRNDFRPKPLPVPGRNEPCVCGSGLKFKRCCAGGPPLTPLNPAELWPFVLEALPAADRNAAIQSGRVPVESLAMTAQRAVEAGRPKTAVGMLEPLFEPVFAGTDDRYGMALSTLCDAYAALDWERKKKDLLDRVRVEAPRSPLRSDACQRLATMAFDRGDSSGAWAAFREAQRDDPEQPAIGLLEVQLLIFEQRLDEARERAKFWRRSLGRQRDPSLADAIEFLSAIIENPGSALTNVAIDSSAGAGERLSAAIADLGARPVPRYILAASAQEPVPDDLHADIANRLRGMGVPAAQIEAMTADLVAQIEDFPEDEADEADEADVQESSGTGTGYRLVAPPAIAVLESDWRDVYPVGKPYSVHAALEPDVDPWDPFIEDRWMSFVERHAEAFDSIEILDDLATAVELHPAAGALHAVGGLQQPLVERAARIVRHAIAERSKDSGPDTVDTVALPWPDTANRPALRCLHTAHALAEQRGDLVRAREHAELLLRLNPGDNHGVRAGLMNLLLRAGDDEAALALAEGFPDDMLAEIPYGKVLAFARLGRWQEATEAARLAARRLPEVRRFLMRERAGQPELEDFGIRIGGKDQAWIYREEMRDVWLETPEALALIRKETGKR